MEKLFLLFVFTVFTFCAFSQNDVKTDATKKPGNDLSTNPDKVFETPTFAPGEKYPTPEQVTVEAVERYYYEQYQISDFFKKYPDYPHFLNNNDLNKDLADYKDRVHKWKSEHKEFQEMLNKQNSSNK